MKVDKQKLLDALNYLASINWLPSEGRCCRERYLSDLDLSEFGNTSPDELEGWRFTGLTNADFIKMKFLAFDANTMRWKEI